MQNFTEENPILLREKGTAADNAGDYEKAALFYALADSLELIEDQSDKIAELEKDLEKCTDYSAYKEFFYDCFAAIKVISEENGSLPYPNWHSTDEKPACSSNSLNSSIPYQ